MCDGSLAMLSEENLPELLRRALQAKREDEEREGGMVLGGHCTSQTRMSPFSTCSPFATPFLKVHTLDRASELDGSGPYMSGHFLLCTQVLSLASAHGSFVAAATSSI